MKINYSIIGSDLNPLYLDFWPIVSKVWKEFFKITPVLGLICEEDSDFEEDNFGLIKKFKKIDGISSALQSQIIRHYLTKLLFGNIIISDIDMIPLSTEYFIDQVREFDFKKIYVMSSDNHQCSMNKEIPMCYNIADSQNFAEIIETGDCWEDFAKKINDMNFGWTADQNYLWIKINKLMSTSPEKVVLLNRGWSNGADRRIDRMNWNYDSKLIKKGYYIDSHLLRPYKQHKEEIDKLISFII